MFAFVWRAAVVLLTILLLYQLWLLGWVVWYAHRPPASTAFMRQELARLQTQDPEARLRYSWCAYDDVSIWLKRSVVAAEDSRFVEHAGVDWDGIERAYEHNRKLTARNQERRARGRTVREKPLRGGSTLTQQLAKNLFLSPSQSYVRKAQELIITWMIEAVMDKRRILELYLNVAQWGEGVFGAQAAARYYFGVSAGQLNAAQASRLAAMLPRPRYFDHNRQSAYLQNRALRLQAQQMAVMLP